MLTNTLKEEDVTALTLSVISGNIARREAMITPAFKNEQAPSDPREMRLQNEIMSAQSSDALTLLGIYESGKKDSSIEEVRDLISDIIKEAGDTIRTQAIPTVSEEDLPIADAVLIEENATVELRNYLGGN